MQHNFKDEVGNVYGKLRVIQYHGRNKTGNAMWECECECGTKTIVSGIQMRYGRVKSCGCYRSEWSKENKTTHGMGSARNREPLYKVWASMKARCSNQNDSAYSNYGGRGIFVCCEWQEFVPFMEWAMSNGYEQGLELDREDNNKGYSPENCRFIPRLQNARNKRSNRYISYRGQTKTMSEWAESIGMKQKTLGRRLHLGWSVEDALTKPIRGQK